ncbi:MAG: glycosyltransferase [Candidatus Pacebacteria bacterium]|jgi:teichuronic acid biosynthesis glycosyltransferase TuaH|nr:glycosyltransferase [Candidatus Paceibacterota bacterium]MBT4004778.1 glycosyltransferase [Candidatus Paceibacterota bacterium]MBT7184131.1 glycosyltransferase [Candidatus Paceibacterota bacterium]MBT7310037.1 glycosyltransferase [Candidatus Paceibacterota bacterium]
MIENKTILIPFTLPWDWSADYQRQTCLELAKTNKVIAYFPYKAVFFSKLITPFGIKHKNIKVEIPKYYFPFRRIPLIEKINQSISLLILKKKLPKNTILWIFDPIFHSYPLQLKSKISLSLYDCVDYHNSLNKKEHFLIRDQEKKLLENSDLVFINSTTLQKVHCRHHPRLVPQGFDENTFIKPAKKRFKLLSNKPLIGFIGGINYRLDFNLIQTLVKNNPQWNFAFVGPIQHDSPNHKDNLENKIKNLSKYQNFILKKGVERKYIPSLIKKFDVAIIPYDINHQFNKYCYPMKLFEYFYIGKPVVATPIKELQLNKFKKIISISNTSKGWEDHINQLLSKPWPNKLQQRQRQLAVENSWSNKIRVIGNNIRQMNYS